MAEALSTVHIQHVIFTLYDPRQHFDSQTGRKDLFRLDGHKANCDVAMGTIGDSDADYTSEEAFGEMWRRFHADSDIHYKPDIEQALESVRKLGAESESLDTLIT